MKAFARLVDGICYLLQLLSGFLIAAMMMIVLLDVITRALFRLTEGGIDLTFLGGIELVKFTLLFSILYALPWCVDRSQVVVDLFTEQLSDRKKAALEGIYFVGYMLLGAGMTYRFYEAVGNAASSGETSQDLLIPMTYIYAATVFGTAMLALRALTVAKDRFCKALGFNA